MVWYARADLENEANSTVGGNLNWEIEAEAAY